MEDYNLYNKIMLVNYLAGCGKDTVADYICEKYGFQRLALAGGIYEIARKYFGMKEKDRPLIIDIGEKMREVRPTVWIDYTLEKAKEYDNVIITDVRQEREYLALLKEGFLPIMPYASKETCYYRLSERDNRVDKLLLETNTELGAREFPAIVVDNNNTLEDLYRQIDNVMTMDCYGYIEELQQKFLN
jgi:cytidylate kinase